MTPKNILCVHQGYELYGSDRVFIQIIERLRHDYPQAHITIHLPEDGSLTEHVTPFCDHLIFKPMGILRRANLSIKNILALPSLIKTIFFCYQQQKKADLIYINTVVNFGHLTAGIFSRKSKILHLHEAPNRLLAFCFSVLISLSRAHIIANSHATRKSFFIPFWQKNTIIYNGIKKRNHIPHYKKNGYFNILQIGRFNALKGQEVLIKAITHLTPKDQKNTRVKIVGDVFEDQYFFWDRIQMLIQKHALSKIIQLKKFKQNTDQLYDWADVIIFPSTKPESFGLISIEAMRAGKPVIASDIGALPEIIQHEKTGLLFPAKNDQALATCLQKYMTDKRLAQIHGSLGKSVFDSKFTEEVFFKQLSAFIRTCHQ